jgi:hypothetical protein
MGPLSSTIYPEVLRSLDTSTLSGGFLPVGSPLVNPCRIIKFTNLSNVNLIISWDGVTNHDILPAGGFVLYDIATNHETSAPFDVSAHTQFYVSAAAGVGLVYISAYFGA